MAGLTVNGFQIKTFAEIRAAIVGNLQVALGPNIETGPSSRIGQFIDIVSTEIQSCWQAMEAVYNSWYPDTASGTSLDNVAAITNTSRLAASSSFSEVFFGAPDSSLGATIATGLLVGKTGTSTVLSLVSPDTLIVDTAYLFLASAVPVNGTVTIEIDGDPVVLNWDDTPEEIAAAFVAALPITSAVVTGSFTETAGFHIKVLGSTIPPGSFAVIGLSSLETTGAIAVTLTPYWSHEEALSVSAIDTGPITLPALSITTFISTVPSLTAVVNLLAGTAGSNGETDAELRARRYEELQKAGTVTLKGIEEAVRGVPGVDSVSIIENATSATVDGRPPHSYEVYVTGGDDDEVAQMIYDTKPVGINPVQTTTGASQRSGSIIDVNGNAATLLFSAPVQVPIAIIVNLTDLPNFPAEGVTQIREALLAYFQNFTLGQDVYNHLLYTPVNTVPGIETLVILSGPASGGPPATAANIVIDPEEIATLTAVNITVNVT